MKFRSVQVLRALAVAGVVFFHASGAEYRPGTLAVVGAGGVDLFFVISGFIIATISKGRTPAQFFIDRLWRIYPMWWVAVLPFLLTQRPEWPGIVSSLTLWPILGNAFTAPALTLGWTLCFEMLFYSATAMALRTRPLIPLSMFAVSLVLGFVSPNALVQFVGSPMILEFLMGAAISKLPKSERLAPAGLTVAIFWLLPTTPPLIRIDATAPEALSRVIAWGVPAALLVYSFLSLERHFAKGWVGPLVLLGDASYSIYLFHILVGRALPLEWPLRAAGMIVIGLAVHLALERPIMQLRRLRRISHQDHSPTAGIRGVEPSG